MAALLLLFITTTQLLLSTPVSSCSPPPSSPLNNNAYCDWCPRPSTASLLPPADDLINGDYGGACGYGATVATTTELSGGGGGLIAVAAGAEFFRDGAGCGDCYQLRCRDRRVCGGVKVVVADAANRTGFLLPMEAFAAMARRRISISSSSDDQPMPGGGLDNNNNVLLQVDFRRVPCEYKRDLAVQVVDPRGSRIEPGRARRRRQLAIRFLYQGGQTDIASVEIAQQQAAVAGSGGGATPPTSWQPLSKARVGGAGVLWRSGSAPPPGPLLLRLVVTAGLGGKWLRAERAVLPADWRPGEVHDTGIRVSDVALRTCARACRATARDGSSEEELR
ncbi:hypothetical protein U9M48_026140 [Paspalum notatum var. saurae]|uniref:Expansin-like EG45 domain-containing protein n=1 Tax=Paspalum notatum var. saurae TaxID=547442 RepID=A0AAQ3TRR2_PASNO